MNQKALELIKNILKQIHDLKPKMPVDLLTENSRFREDLGFDSLAMASFFYELQDIYPDLDENQIKKWKTVSDCMQAIAEYQ